MRYPTIFAADSQIKLLPTVPANPLQCETFFLHANMLTSRTVAKVLNILLEHGSYSRLQPPHYLKGIIAPINATILKKRVLPAFTRIDAAGGLILSPSQHYLFILRNGFWDLPKGKVEAGETLAQAALREVKEETGIEEVEIVRELTTTWHTYYMAGQTKPILKKTRWFLMRAAQESKLVPQIEEGIVGAYWLPYEDAVEIIPNAYRSVAQVFKAVNADS